MINSLLDPKLVADPTVLKLSRMTQEKEQFDVTNQQNIYPEANKS